MSDSMGSLATEKLGSERLLITSFILFVQQNNFCICKNDFLFEDPERATVNDINNLKENFFKLLESK